MPIRMDPTKYELIELYKAIALAIFLNFEGSCNRHSPISPLLHRNEARFVNENWLEIALCNSTIGTIFCQQKI